MIRWTIEKKKLELQYTWKISRNASDVKTNLFVRAEDGSHSGIGEVAPNIRYGESPEQTEDQFTRFLSSKPETIRTTAELIESTSGLRLAPSLRFGIESAFTHCICSRDKIQVQDFLGIGKADAVPISFSIPIMDIGRIKEFYFQDNLKRFHFLKIKVNAEEMSECIRHLSSFTGQPLLIDANEAFTDVDVCIHSLEKIRKNNIELVEQPMPAGMDEESVYLKKYSPFPLFADESVRDAADFTTLKKMFDGANIKLMTAGGYRNAIRLLNEARECGMKTMIGCMVETTLGISSGLNLCSLADYADLDSYLVLKEEPFGLVKEENGILFFTENAGSHLKNMS